MHTRKGKRSEPQSQRCRRSGLQPLPLAAKDKLWKATWLLIRLSAVTFDTRSEQHSEEAECRRRPLIKCSGLAGCTTLAAPSNGEQRPSVAWGESHGRQGLRQVAVNADSGSHAGDQRRCGQSSVPHQHRQNCKLWNGPGKSAQEVTGARTLRHLSTSAQSCLQCGAAVAAASTPRDPLPIT